MSNRYVKIGLLVAGLIAFFAVIHFLPVNDWIRAFTEYVRGLGFLGYVLYVLAYIVCCVAFLPAFLLTVSAGAIFGFWWGSVIVIIGATLGATAAFLLGRTVLRHRVETMIEGNKKFAAVDKAIATEGVKILLLVRLGGFPPFTWVNYAFGLTGIRLLPYVLTTLIGIIPGTMAFTYAGSVGAALAKGGGNRITLIITAIGAIVVSIVVARIASRAIKRAGVEA